MNKDPYEKEKELIDYSQIDEPIRELCEAINTNSGIMTFESCCGHLEQPIRIWFKASSHEDFHTLVFNTFNQISNWEIVFDNSDINRDIKEGLKFCLRSKSLGKKAYSQVPQLVEAFLV